MKQNTTTKQTITIKNLTVGEYTNIFEPNRFGSYQINGTVVLDTKEALELQDILSSFEQNVPDLEGYKKFIGWSVEEEIDPDGTYEYLQIRAKLKAYGTYKGRKFKRHIKVVNGKTGRQIKSEREAGIVEGSKIDIVCTVFPWQMDSKMILGVSLQPKEVIVHP